MFDKEIILGLVAKELEERLKHLLQLMQIILSILIWELTFFSIFSNHLLKHLASKYLFYNIFYLNNYFYFHLFKKKYFSLYVFSKQTNNSTQISIHGNPNYIHSNFLLFLSIFFQMYLPSSIFHSFIESLISSLICVKNT